MDTCFHFLINVDQCLNMSNFDMFFYKLESQHRFYLKNVTFLSETPGDSLRSVIEDIRMYLDKYPFRVGDYQITLTMRQPFRKERTWETSVLYRVLRIMYELKRAHIFVGSKESIEKTVNVIMLYDSDFRVESVSLDDYWENSFETEYRLLLDALKTPMEQIGSEQEFSAYLQEIYQKIEKKKYTDEGVRYLLKCFVKRFCSTREETIPYDWETEGDEELDLSAFELLEEDRKETRISHLDHSWMLKQYIKERTAGIQIFERLIDRNSRKQMILSLLRIVDFITMGDDMPITKEKDIRSLYSISQARWKKVWEDENLEARYSKMLWNYQNSLKHALQEAERPYADFGEKEKLPKYEPPKEIKSSEKRSSSSKEDRLEELSQILKNFLAKSSGQAAVLKEQWDSTYKTLKDRLGHMEQDLHLYAEDLSTQYKFVLEKRKEEVRRWKTQKIYADRETAKKIVELGMERERKLSNLKSPHMNPSLSFQDQLNMENALEQTNLDIQFYIACLKMITMVNFLILLVICAGIGILQYTLFQVYALQVTGTMLAWLAYSGLCIAGMFLTWRMPFWYFRRKMKKSVQKLQKSMELYVAGFFKKEEDFCAYMNEINQLDYITRYLRLLEGADKEAKEKASKYLWHREQIRNHLDKLTFFQGLIDNYSIFSAHDDDEAPSSRNIEPEKDVVDCQLYWPQG